MIFALKLFIVVSMEEHTTVEYQGTLIAVISIGYIPHTGWSSNISFKNCKWLNYITKNVGDMEQDYTIYYLIIFK